MDDEWQIGLIVGPSGSGKSQIAKRAFGTLGHHHDWANRPLIDEFPKGMSVKDACDLLTRVGLSSTPSWTIPYSCLSTGQKFRADIAMAIAEVGQQDVIVIDEFTSSHDISSRATSYIATVEDRPAAFIALIPYPSNKYGMTTRVHRIVVLPDFQGLGIAHVLLREVCGRVGNNCYISTSHAPFAKSLAKSREWSVCRQPSMCAPLGKNASATPARYWPFIRHHNAIEASAVLVLYRVVHFAAIDRNDACGFSSKRPGCLQAATYDKITIGNPTPAHLYDFSTGGDQRHQRLTDDQAAHSFHAVQPTGPGSGVG
jgi:GNAT superfamily N-acetyltransferase